jgi:hypothetical protein
MTVGLGETKDSRVILLYQNSEKASIESVKDILRECGIVPIACENPSNFRFVVPEVVCSANVDLIGRLALQALGTDKPLTNFANAVRQAIAPLATPKVKP